MKDDELISQLKCKLGRCETAALHPYFPCPHATDPAKTARNLAAIKARAALYARVVTLFKIPASSKAISIAKQDEASTVYLHSSDGVAVSTAPLTQGGIPDQRALDIEPIFAKVLRETLPWCATLLWISQQPLRDAGLHLASARVTFSDVFAKFTVQVFGGAAG